MYNRRVKRLLDLAVAAPLLVALAPAGVVIGIVVVLDSGFPAFYRGERGGLGGRPFRILKFRTMVPEAERIGGGTTALADPRITRSGVFLRRTKLDELPQILNIIRGEMSLVGPRPELLQYTSRYSGLERYILQVRPGITDFSSLEYIDLGEVVGRSEPDAVYERDVLEHKNMLRIEYVERMSLRTDVRLFTSTVARALGKLLGGTGGQRRRSGTHHTWEE